MTQTLEQTAWFERALVNSLVLRAQDGQRDRPQARPDQLADEQSAAALRSYLSLIDSGDPPLYITLYQMAGGETLLADIDGINSGMWEVYDEQVIKAWRERRSIELANLARVRVASANTIQDVDLTDLMDQASALEPVSEEDQAAGAIADKADQMVAWARDPHALIGVTSGITIIDRYTAGLRPVLHGIGARPNMGKTSFMAQCVSGQIAAGLHVYVAALEDGAGEVANRMALQQLRIPKEDLRKGNNLDRYLGLMADIRDHQSLTWHDGDPTVASLALSLAKASEHRRIDCIWIDHLGYIQHEKEDGANLAYRIGLTTKALQRLSLQYRVPVMMLVQLSRDSADGTPPELTGFRDSGAIEEVIRIGWFLHRPAYYADSPPAPHLPQPYQLWVRKAKDMPTGPINMVFTPATATISESRVDHVR